ncbi:membrane protein [Roseivivax halodurans JCM 10272]|uniref:Membrane protein n=1 Tax=Roseivivax halodurans JCM 10272 TaxID=1449350 RepID=X7EL01_9RHOB|nr:hypothetical protein [Roseivivax halodurans]ETX16597.1 membrane protein [Roseivivax halodurans JCM 10272]
MSWPKILDRHQSLWFLITGPTLWALHFCTVYAMTAIYCEKLGDEAGPLRLGILGVTLGALVLIGITAWLSWRQWDYTDDWDYEHDGLTVEDRREFIGHAGFLLCVVSVIGVIYVALPAAFVGSCV